ncbi:pol protein [Cucumis melo var. makuwa]|uniref:Pol protein n=1 Tax=Cucumis melo var. makuwa TaxID=1194695 RepID=A0A5A7V7N4_CUCMM|nr:pol protein [Cucumis melo var. makuwa]TYK28607.1 pol protein [Cucumis melo var. makuwa]
MKAPRQRPTELLQPLGVPEWKWESVSMDFITGLPRTLKGYTVIWVVVERLTKSAHFIPGKSTYTANKDARFPSKFWKGLQLASGTRLDFSTTFHPQTDGQTESYQATIVMAPFEALYGKCCRSPVVGSRQKSYANERRKDLEFEVGDMVFLKVAPMKGVLMFEKKGKLSPRFVGAFEIPERIGPVAYLLALPTSFSAVHDVFHVSMLRRYVSDPMNVVDFEPLQINEDLSYEEQPVEILAREVKMLRNRGISLVKIRHRHQPIAQPSPPNPPSLCTYDRRRKWTATVSRSREPDPHARVPSFAVCPDPLSSAPVHQTPPRSIVNHRSLLPPGQSRIVERSSPTVSAVARTRNPTRAPASLHRVKPRRAAAAQSSPSRARAYAVAEPHSRRACPSHLLLSSQAA